MKYTFVMAICGMMYMPNFMEIDTGVKADIRNLRGCNVGITDMGICELCH
jgi:hypothetical protein